MNTLLKQEEFKDMPYLPCREKVMIMMVMMMCNLLLPPSNLGPSLLFLVIVPSIVWMSEVDSFLLGMILF